MCYISLLISSISFLKKQRFSSQQSKFHCCLLLYLEYFCAQYKGVSQSLSSVCAWKRRQQHPVLITHIQNGQGCLTFSHLSNRTEDVCGTEQVRVMVWFHWLHILKLYKTFTVLSLILYQFSFSFRIVSSLPNEKLLST